VDNGLEHVGVPPLGHRLEEVSRDHVAAGRESFTRDPTPCSFDDLWLVEQDPVELRVGLEDCHEKRAMPFNTP
jgi:hypothetical protein